MSDVQSPPQIMGPPPSFEIGAAVTASFGVFFKKPIYFTALTLVGIVVMYVLALVIMVPAVLILEGQEANVEELAGLFTALPALVGLFFGIGFIWVQCVIIRSAISVKVEGKAQLGRSIGAASSSFIPLALMFLILLIPIGLGYLFFIVPGLFLAAMFYVLIPVAVNEGRGFGALGRCLSLTAGYRWALVGFMLIMMLIGIGISFAISLVGGLLTLPATLIPEAGVVGIVIQVIGIVIYLFGAFAGSALGFIACAIAYLRLREIKEGAGEELLKVFE